MAKFNYDLASIVLVEAAYTSDKEAVEHYGISLRTVYNWRKRLDKDPEFADFFKRKKALIDKEWASKIPPAICSCIDFLNKATKEMNPASNENVYTMAGVFKILSDVEITKRLLDVRLADIAREADEAV